MRITMSLESQLKRLVLYIIVLLIYIALLNPAIPIVKNSIDYLLLHFFLAYLQAHYLYLLVVLLGL